MLNFAHSTQQTWWLPLARRSVHWGASMAALWATWPLCFFLAVWLARAQNPLLLENVNVLIPAFFSLPLAFCWAIAGGITGIVSGYYAPANDPANPLRSRFFRRVGWRTFWGWNLSFIGACVGFWLSNLAPPVLFLLILGAGLLVLNLWRAVSRAFERS